MNKSRWIRDTSISALILLLSFAASLLIQLFWNTETLIPSVFVLAVFLVSLCTEGYLYGILSALISVLAVNFAFTFPFFAFDFTIPENLVSAVIMICVTVVTSTLTSKIKMQEALRVETEREKMRANLLRAISHDLRTPLTTIYGASSAIIDNYQVLKDQEKIQMLKGINEDSLWLIRMVENLLSVTKIDGRNVKIIKTSVVLEELIDSVLQKFKKRFPNQSVSLKLPDDFVGVSADPILIEQVIINLLENAVHHAVGMTQLELSVDVQDKSVIFHVMDDGCGIDQERINQINAGKFVSDSSFADNSKPFMGIGLSVCKTIVHAHGGRFYSESRPNGGSCFSFTLERDLISYE